MNSWGDKTDMENHIKDLVELDKRLNQNLLQDASMAKKMMFLYALNHYFNGDEDYLLDVREGAETNSESPIYGVYEDPEAFDGKVLEVISSRYITNDTRFDFDSIKSLFLTIQTIISDEKNLNYLSPLTSEVLKGLIDKYSEETFTIKVITNYVPSFDEKEEYDLMMEKLTPASDKFKFEILFGDDILDEIDRLNSDKKCVESGYLALESSDNCCFYGKERSLITNIMASSLKENYVKHGKRGGLFALNLRFYVSDKKVDPALSNSIRNKGENFWYYNNGIIIVCDDYEIRDDKVYLTNYSIVNGGQTTRMIGVTPFTKDFAVSCKIIKNKYESKTDNLNFVSEIAEASNTQKPINSTDIIANKPEQRLLKENLSDAGIFVSIKRGDSASANLKVNYPEPWQKAKNSEIGQLLYGSIYQKPGVARNSKDKIFSDSKKYELIFGHYNQEKYSNALIKDILILRSLYKKWSVEVAKDEMADLDKKGLSKNGSYFFLACATLMMKLYYSKDLADYICHLGIASEKAIQVYSSRTFNHRMLNDEYGALENRIFDLFNLIYDRYLSRAFRLIKEIKPDYLVSNFTKIDKNYQSYVTMSIVDDFGEEIASKVETVLTRIAYQPTPEEISNDKVLYETAIAGKAEPIVEPVVDENSQILDNRLTEYRTKQYKLRGCKAYDIFTNKEKEAIVKLKPQELKDFENMQIFKFHSRLKIKQFGQDIIEIVKSVIK